MLTFLPVNLFQQFSRVANFYFLIIAALQLIPGLSPTPWITTVAPLLFVLLLNGAKVPVTTVHIQIPFKSAWESVQARPFSSEQAVNMHEVLAVITVGTPQCPLHAQMYVGAACHS